AYVLVAAETRRGHVQADRAQGPVPLPSRVAPAPAPASGPAPAPASASASASGMVPDRARPGSRAGDAVTPTVPVRKDHIEQVVAAANALACWDHRYGGGGPVCEAAMAELRRGAG